MPLRAMRMGHEWIGPEAQEENKVVQVGLMVS
jgi:hypothetical protein